MQKNEFLMAFGEAIRHHRAAVFVGAGVSKGSGFPNWDELIAPLKEAANVPDSVKDATLAAEYALQVLKMNEVERLLLEKLRGFTPGPNDTLTELLSIGFAEIWTTNFDTLIEDADESLDLVVKDGDYEGASSKGRRLTKLHGSLKKEPSGDISWHEPPVITRSHFEAFERVHPLKWAMLRAQFLTSSFLFLGFSFADPNVGALLRIVRSLPSEIRRLPHFAVMKTPTDTQQKIEFELFRRDMRDSGVHIIDIADYHELPDLLRGLARNALPPNIFVSGKAEQSATKSICAAIGAALTDLKGELTIMSFDGTASREINRTFKKTLRPESYRAEQIRTYYRQSPTGDGEISVQRFGTAVFTEKTLEDMRREVFSQVRVLVLVGDGDRALEEAELALEQNIPVIPVASSGEAARLIWERGRETCGFAGDATNHDWQLLAQAEPAVSARAVNSLLAVVFGG